MVYTILTTTIDGVLYYTGQAFTSEHGDADYIFERDCWTDIEQNQYLVPEYTVEINPAYSMGSTPTKEYPMYILRKIDISARLNQIQTTKDARAYLYSTDWYSIRNNETGEAIPEYIEAKRQQCRGILSDDAQRSKYDNI